MSVSRVQINDRWIEIANNVESIEGTMIEQYINDAMQSYKEVDPPIMNNGDIGINKGYDGKSLAIIIVKRP